LRFSVRTAATEVTKGAEMAEELQGRARELDNLIQVKTQLAERTDRKAKATNSRPARTRLVRRADRFRRQAVEAARKRDAVIAAKQG
jgi:hypothetical protein